jgi:CheY-like chemotaxis protein
VRPSVVLADDHREVATALVRLLKSDFDVVAVVRNGHTLIESVEQLTPDAVVTDINLEGSDGLSAVREIRNRFPVLPIVVISGSVDPGPRRHGVLPRSIRVPVQAATSLRSLLHRLLESAP